MTRSPHHANLLIGSPEAARSYLDKLSKELGIKLANNPDFFVFRMETFGIDEARELKQVASRKALTERKIILIIPSRLTPEAQNALLKTFEDPGSETYFFLVTRDESQIIPTLRSRLNSVRLPESHEVHSVDAEKFLTLSLKERLLFVKKLIDKEISMPDFLDDLLLLLRGQNNPKIDVEQVYDLRRFAGDAAASPRLILEHLALVIQ